MGVKIGGFKDLEPLNKEMTIHHDDDSRTELLIDSEGDLNWDWYGDGFEKSHLFTKPEALELAYAILKLYDEDETTI